MEQRPGRAALHAFAAGGAGIRLAPRLVEVGDDAGVAAAAGDVLGAGALDVPAHPHATRAKDAAVVIHAKEAVGVVHAPFRKAIVVADVINALAPGEGLQLAMAVGDTDGANDDSARPAAIPASCGGIFAAARCRS